MAQRTTRAPRPGVRALNPRHLSADATFGTRLVVAAIATALVTVPFALALVLVESQWPPLHRLDRTTAERLHQTALEHPGWVSVLEFLTSYVWDPVTMRLLVAVLVVWLLTRRAWRLAAWASVTAVAGGLIGLLTKHMVERARPHLPDPVSHAPGFSFPSGHAMTATTSCAVLLLVLMPLVPRAWRALPWLLAVTTTLGVGYTRVALGVHWVSDVVGGWLLGVTVVTATTLAFEAWRLDTGRRRTTPAQGLEPELASAAPEPPLDLRHVPGLPDAHDKSDLSDAHHTPAPSNEPHDPPRTHHSG
ncbi:phosphatase PAP2 family protein [Streptomyces sp. NPDC090301]|uniref:phosphatase PAP2 family protein n=1 Tax=Streptomyces sp. NPDC090301 TaxID=3154975 RepID=UPI003431B629